MTVLTDLEKTLGKGRVRVDQPMGKDTTFGVGGPADFFYETKRGKELVGAINLAKKLDLPIFILGAGSNLVVSDKGIRWLVIKNSCLEFSFKPFSETFSPPKINSRFKQKDDSLTSSKDNHRFVVTAGSGWRLPSLINRCFKEGLIGLEWFAGIPGSLGGAVYMNIHGADLFLSDFVYRVRVWDEKKDKEEYLDYHQLKFGYDYSIFHEKQFIIISVDLILRQGDIAKAKKRYGSWLKAKIRIQPQRSSGSIWQNLSAAEQKKHNLPTAGIGYLIDKRLGLKGKKIGRARISIKHAGFIENLGGASAADVLELIGLVEKRAKKELGIELKREVELVGEF